MTDPFAAFDMIEKEGMVTDAPASDDVSISLEKRSQAHIEQDNINWLLNQDPEATEGLDSAYSYVSDNEIPAHDDDDRPIWMRIAGDLARGATEAPSQAIGGLVDSVDSVSQLGEHVTNTFFEDTSFDFVNGGIQIFDDDGNFDIGLATPDQMRKLRSEDNTVFDALTSDDAESVTGSAIRGIAQFVGPFAAANKFLKSRKLFSGATKVAKYGRIATSGAIADALAFDGHDERLSNLVETVPALQNPITEYLAADDDDSEIEGRLKNAIEGVGAGFLVDAAVSGIRGVRAFRNSKSGKSSAERSATAMKFADDMEVLREATPLDALGDPSDDAELLMKHPLPEMGVPEDIVANSLVKGARPLEEGGDKFINWARIQTPEDIQQVMNDTATAFVDDVDEAARGVRTNKQTIISAEQEDAWELLQSRRKGDPLNAEQSVAARNLYVASAHKVFATARTAAESPTPENLFVFRRMLATFHAVQSEVLAARTETARALQSWAIPVGGNKEMMRDMTNAINVSGGVDTSLDIANRVAALQGNPDNLAVLSKFAEKSVYAKTRDSIQEYWINALLSGPKTHLVNAMSNTSVMILSVLERRVAASINKLLGGEAGVEIGEAAAQINGLTNGFGDALRNAAKSARTGKTGFGVNKIELGRTRSISSTNWNVRSDSWAGKAVDTLGAGVNVPGRALQTADEFFKTLGYRMELHAQAFRQAQKEIDAGKLSPEDFKSRMADIIQDPPESIRMESVAAAAYQTFTSEPGKFTKKLSGIINQYPMLRFIMPFVNTPSNILAYTFERTPLAPLTARYRNAIAEGGAKADIARSRMAIGTMSIMFSVDLAMKGQITGSGPSNSAEKQNWRRQGFQPYSIKMGNRWYAYNRMDPIGYLLGIGADIGEFTLNAEFDEETGAELQEALAAAVFSIAEGATSKSYLQGVSMLAEAIAEPDRRAATYVERFASSFVPSIVRETARFDDPVMRVPHDIISAMKNRVPGFSDDLPLRRDVWGREISYESGLGKAYDAVSPIYASQHKPEPIDEAMAEHGFFIGMPSKALTVDGERVGLKNRPDVYSRYLELQGTTKPDDFEAFGVADTYGNKTLLETLNDVVTGQSHLSERYKDAADPEAKQDVINRVVRRYRRAARKQLIVEFPELTVAADRKRASRVGD